MRDNFVNNRTDIFATYIKTAYIQRLIFNDSLSSEQCIFRFLEKNSFIILKRKYKTFLHMFITEILNQDFHI